MQEGTSLCWSSEDYVKWLGEGLRKNKDAEDSNELNPHFARLANPVWLVWGDKMKSFISVIKVGMNMTNYIDKEDY